ncbi:MAG: DUF3048 domain-containing protein [Candidatus Portnoybacteria bacterium]|nr:DUF3048 domain-containing protein [Candidatus Portnoybacteria bacterium]
MSKMKKKKTIIIIIVLIIIASLIFINSGRSVDIDNKEQKEQNSENISPITGTKCPTPEQRPFAVMLAIDSKTRPLSGISQADIVVEMPVITDSITRLMAVYNCQKPEEIGSIRSARHDYIPLAMGLDAIYCHWGGSHFALDKLDNNIMDNIDALKNPYNAYYRKNNIDPPHNGFTSYQRLLNAAEKIGYRTENKFEGYPHLKDPKAKAKGGTLIIGYKGKYRVHYEYDSETNTYLRWRNDQREIDKNTYEQVSTSVVAVMKAESRQIEGPDYNDVDVEGSGEAIIYQNGEEIKGYWKKQGKDTNTKLYFLNPQGEEIKFTPGKIWIQIVEPHYEIKWQPQQ